MLLWFPLKLLKRWAYELLTNKDRNRNRRAFILRNVKVWATLLAWILYLQIPIVVYLNRHSLPFSEQWRSVVVE